MSSAGLNIGGLRDASFGAAKRGPVGGATFPTAAAAANALLSVSYRAAPRDWKIVSDAEMASLARYPLDAARKAVLSGPLDAGPSDKVPLAIRGGGIMYVDHGTAARAWATRHDDGSWDLTTAAPLDLGWWPGFGPSDEAQRTFQGLVADWEAYDRIGVGSKVLPHLREDVADWRKFREEWLNADIDSSDIGGRLTGEVIRSNRVRLNLKEAGISDPLLSPELRRGVEVTQAVDALAPAAKVDTWARSTPIVNWLTDPAQKDISLFGFPIPANVAALVGAGVGLLVLLGAARAVRAQ